MAGALEVQNRILEVAGSQFFSLGFTKVTMDEIAHELGLSKRTLYQYFPGKKPCCARPSSAGPNESQKV